MKNKMKNKKLHLMTRIFLVLLFCAAGMTTLQAQPLTGPGVDPNAVIFDDFENGSTSKWRAIVQGRGERANIELMSAANGDPVRFGNYALRFNMDHTDAEASTTCGSYLTPTSNAIPVTTNNRRLGMWMYATPGIQGMWLRLGTTTTSGGSMTSTDFVPDAINWTGWKYVYVDIPNGHNFFHSTNGIRFVVLASYANYYVNGYVLIDNVRITDRTVAEDLNPPTISALTVNSANVSGQTLTTNTVDLSATFSDTGGSQMNFNSLRMIVDGYVFKAGDAGFSVTETNANSGSVSLNGLNLGNGQHTVVAHVEDNFGHITTRTGSFTINASGGTTTTITLEPDAQATVGSTFEMKINTNDLKDVKELDMSLEFQSNIGSIASSGSVVFAASAAGSSYSFNTGTRVLTINLKNNADAAAAGAGTLATIKVDIPKNSSETDVLICSPVTAKAVYADDSFSLFSLFSRFTRDVKATYDFTVLDRIVGAPGKVLVTDKATGNPIPGATVYAHNISSGNVGSLITSAVTDAEGIASGMSFTGSAQSIYIYAEKSEQYSYTKAVRVLSSTLAATPSGIRSGTTVDPTTSKTIVWMSHPVSSPGPAIMKIAKKSDGADSFVEHTGITELLEFEASASSGVAKGSKVTVTGLSPGTDYIYQVGNGTNWSSTREFRTTTVTDKFSFSAFGDLQASSNSDMSMCLAAGNTIRDMETKPFFSLNVGDIPDNDSRWDYHSYYTYWFDQRPEFANIDMAATYGNHEYMGTPDANNIKFLNGHPTIGPSANYNVAAVGNGTYAAVYGNMLVIGLDWEHKGGGYNYATRQTEQAKWMDEVMTKYSNKTWKIVTLHYDMTQNTTDFTVGALDRMQPTLDKHNVQIVFCGHGHTFRRIQVKGTTKTPSSWIRTGEPVLGAGTLHFQIGGIAPITGEGNRRWVFAEVDGGKMTVTSRDFSNNIVAGECFTLYASPQDPHAVNFDVLNGNGTLTATAGGEEIDTGDEVTQGRNVVFTATPENGYSVKEWKLNGTSVEGNKTNSYILENLKAEATVTVEFELTGVGIEIPFASTLQIYPNPFTNGLNIAGAENCTLQVIDVVGKLVYAQKITDTNEVVRLNQLSAGVYFFRLEKDGQAKTIKVMKK